MWVQNISIFMTKANQEFKTRSRFLSPSSYSDLPIKMEFPLNKTFTILIFSLFGEVSLHMISEVVGRDVLLPCLFTPESNLDPEKLIINWQGTDDNSVVHSFYSNVDHPEYQNQKFRGRTQLFPKVILNGNASLQLRRLTLSDNGNYTCYVIQHDDHAYVKIVVELRVLDTDTSQVTEDNNLEDQIPKEQIRRLGTAAVFFVIVGIGIGIGIKIAIRKSIMKKQRHMDPERAALIRYPNMADALEDYKLYLTKKYSNMINSNMSKCYASLMRTVDVTYPKKEGKFIEGINGGGSDNTKEIKPTEMLSVALGKKCSSKRILMVGDAGVGKSWTVTCMRQEWASESNEQPFKCIIILRFHDLNKVKEKTTLRKLLQSKCSSLSEVLSALLLDPHDVLITLDGLDEFHHQLSCDAPIRDIDIDTEADVNVLVSDLICGQLLPAAHILVTSRWNNDQIKINKKYFDCILAISGFTTNQLRQYCDVFYQDKETASKMYQHFTEKETITYLACNPLNSYMLCNILKTCKDYSEGVTAVPVTQSKLFSLFFDSLFSHGTPGTDQSHKLSATDLEKCKDRPHDKIVETILKVGKLSYHYLLSGKHNMVEKDLIAFDINPTFLSSHLSNLILEKKWDNRSSFEFYHAMIMEQVAAWYCADLVRDKAEELIECLDLWCLGKVPQNSKNPLCIEAAKWPEHKKNLFSFTKMFMGFLTAGRGGNFWKSAAPLSDSTSQALVRWFRDWLCTDIKQSELLNLMHCLFELHDNKVTEEVSPHIKRIDFYNISLSLLDIAALCYSLRHSQVEKMDLRLCDLKDQGIRQLEEVIAKCKSVSISSNKLTEESARIISNILQEPSCALERLSIGTNHLQSSGAQMIWKALEKNQRLKRLYLYDNGITDKGTEIMPECLKHNKTLEVLHLCGNTFSDCGQRNIQRVKELRADLKIVVKIADDEELVDRVENEVTQLISDFGQYDREWLTNILRTILRDLGDEISITNTRTETKIGNIKQGIQIVQRKLKWDAIAEL
ncbi:protein NLRC3-like isoform X1 [Callorhinchus milii]|uniref:protein NLRC3-like isoform X1 n=2 Tax=Callorhinchus milii TaxID=7868 RepID=UPI001C3F7174|nr:protein NLRC3-like isoform X1 [Callorhinchus milii]XP_042191491.1 protein NLRC3-like isoform X1 [Callorhinchus milii]